MSTGQGEGAQGQNPKPLFVIISSLQTGQHLHCAVSQEDAEPGGGMQRPWVPSRAQA